MTGDERDEDFDYGDMPTDEAEAFRAGWKAALAAIPAAPTQEWRLKVWNNMEQHAEVGNLRPGHIMGNGHPDYFWNLAAAAIRAMKPPHNP